VERCMLPRSAVIFNEMIRQTSESARGVFKLVATSRYGVKPSILNNSSLVFFFLVT
jgi:hypothetical protein